MVTECTKLQSITAILFTFCCICLVQGSVPTSIPSQNITVKNFSCITYGWEGYVECTWDYDANDIYNISIKWQLIYLILPNNKTISNEAWNECPNKDKTLNSCTLDIIGTAFRLCIGVSKQKFCKIVNIKALVKPNPVQLLKTTFKNSTDVILQWKHNRYYNKMFQLVISSYRMPSVKVFVEFEYINSTRQICSTNSRYDVTCERKLMEISFANLSRCTLYTISVTSKPLNNGFWSEKRTITLQTDKDVPSIPPAVRPGSYSIQLKPDRISVYTIYWQPIPKDNWNGEDITYRIQFMVGSTVVQKVINTTDFSASFQPASDDGTISVVLWAQNEIGRSKQTSEVLIYNHELQHVDEIVAIKNSLNTTDVFWKHTRVRYVKLYEVFWCVQAFANICKKTPSSAMISSNRSNLTIDGQFNELSSYLFGVSYTTNDNITSGFIWSDCFIDLTTNGSMLSLEASLHQERNGMRIKWWFTKCNYETVHKQIKFYRIDTCHHKRCRDYVERKVARTEHTILLDKSELKQVVCARVTAKWNVGKQKSSSLVCIEVEHNDGDVGPILLAVGAIFTILALFGCCMIISKAMAIVQKVRKPLTFELPVLNDNGSIETENSGSRLLDT